MATEQIPCHTIETDPAKYVVATIGRKSAEREQVEMAQIRNSLTRSKGAYKVFKLTTTAESLGALGKLYSGVVCENSQSELGEFLS